MRLVASAVIAFLIVGGGFVEAQGDLIFADGFEDGSSNAWSTVVGFAINPVIDLRADVNRNGTVDLTDPSEDQNEDTWDSTHGAIFLANMDDDQSACPTTGSDPELAACHDAADEVVNGPEDELDLAKLIVAPWPAAPNDATAMISLSTPGSSKVRMFRRVGASFVVFDPTVDSLTAAELCTGVDLAMEATDIVRDSASWDGFVDVTLDVEAGSGPGGPLADGSDTIRFRIAPVLFRHHLEGLETAYVTELASAASQAFRNDLATAMSTAGVPNPLYGFSGIGDQWTQDFLETAYMSMPAVGAQHTIHINCRSANYSFGNLREAGRVVFTHLRGPDVAGAVQYDPAHPNGMDTLNSFGNLETIPPHDDGRSVWPLGRVIRGSDPSFYPDPSFDELVNAQGMQPIVKIDTSWLLVGHIDETMSFLPEASPRGWVLLAADVTGAWNALVDAHNTGYGNTSMFIGKTWSGGSSAETSITEVVVDTDLVNANSWAVAEIDSQITQLSTATGLSGSEIVDAPFIFWEQSGWLIAYVPGLVNGVVLSDGHFAAPDPHGPFISGQDLFKDMFSQNLATVGYVPHWIENWDLYHRLGGEVHCGSNATRAVPVEPWWEVAP